jgi:hypothetical protein
LSTTRSRIAPLLLPTLVALAAAACGGARKSGAPPGNAAAVPALAPAAATALIEWRRPAGLPGISAPPAAVLPDSERAAAAGTGAAVGTGATAGTGSAARTGATAGAGSTVGAGATTGAGATRGPGVTTGPGATTGPAAPPGPGAAGPGGVPWERVTIDLGGLWVGPEDPREGPRVHYLFARRRRTEDLAQFVHDYAPFRTVERGVSAAGGSGGAAGGAGPGPASELVFHGRGAVQASAAERRMIGEWTRAVAVEAVGDAGSPSPYGLAFAWHRGAASGGVCDDLVVYVTGEVRAGSCGAGAEVSGRLAGERLQRLYGWIDGLAAFQDAGEQELRAGALLDRLIFAGRGRQRASAGEIAAIETFAGSLHRELTAAAPAPTVETPAATQIAAAALPKAAPPPQGEAPAEAAAVGTEPAAGTEEAADPEANASSPPAEPLEAPRPPRRREVDVPDEPDEAPPPEERPGERPAAARAAAAPPAPGAAPSAAGASQPQRQPSRKRQAAATTGTAPPAPGAAPPAAGTSPPRQRQPSRKRPAKAAPKPAPAVAPDAFPSPPPP